MSLISGSLPLATGLSLCKGLTTVASTPHRCLRISLISQSLPLATTQRQNRQTGESTIVPPLPPFRVAGGKYARQDRAARSGSGTALNRIQKQPAAHAGKETNAQNESQAEGLFRDTRPEKLHAHKREHARLRKVRLHASRPAHADTGCGAVLRHMLPALFATDETGA
jgi:hypothetical protein